jgi:hypothetical protein
MIFSISALGKLGVNSLERNCLSISSPLGPAKVAFR